MPLGFFSRNWLPLALVVIVLAAYFSLAKRLLSFATASQIELVVLAVLVLALLVGLVLSLGSLASRVFIRERTASSDRLSDRVSFVLAVIVVLGLFVAASQWAAFTPPILGDGGQPLAGSIASLEKTSLGGVDQWLIVRGQDETRPVLLFLSGGPGGSEAARVLRFNRALEEHFVVVIWEQRGCGKSYPSLNPVADLTVDQYVSDIVDLGETLRERFDEQKIYLVGHSWGSIIGVRAAQVRPDMFHAYIGTAQMVDVRESDQIIFDMVMEHSLQSGDTRFVQTLESQGEPPYLGKNPIGPYATLFGREYSLYEFPGIKDEAYRRDGDILMLMLKQPEYGWLDRVYYLLGLMNTFNAVYPQLQDMDFREDATSLDLPVYLVAGRHDMNAPTELTRQYFDLLQAPHKQLVFFEDSGHGMIWEEADRFHDLMVETVLPETYH